MNRIFLLAGLMAIAAAAPLSAQTLGLWQDHVGEGIAYGEPAQAFAIVPADPVRVLPIAPRPVAPAAPRLAPVSAAVKAVESPAAPVAQSDGPVGNFLARPYDADVPLPHPDLEGMAGQPRRSMRPQPYATGGVGGATFGVSVPLPADRVTIATKNTRSGNGVAAP